VADRHQQFLLEDGVPCVLWLAREVQLGCEDGAVGRLDLDVDVPGAARIQAGDDGDEPVATAVVGEQMAAQPVAGVVVLAVGVRLPPVEERSAYPLTRRREDGTGGDESGALAAVGR